MAGPGGSEDLVVRTAFRQASAGSRVFIVVAGVVVPILLFGYAGFAWLSSGSADAAEFPAAFGAAFLVVALGQSVPQTLRLGRHEICLETPWTRSTIALTNVERVAVAKEKPMVAVASKSGTQIAAGEGFSEAEKAGLAAALRARLPSEVPREEYDRMPFGWGSENEDEALQHRERRYRPALKIIIALGSIAFFSLLGLGTLAMWSATFGCFMLLAIASFALMLATVATHRRTFMIHGALLMGIAMLLVTGYPVLAAMMGTNAEFSFEFPSNLVFIIGGLTLLLFYGSELHALRSRSGHVETTKPHEASLLRTPSGILSAVLVIGIAVLAVIQGSSDFPAGVRWGYVAASFGALIWFFRATEEASAQKPPMPFPAVFVRAERGLVFTGAIGLPIGAWQFIELGSPGPAIWCVSAGLFLVVWLFRMLPKARAIVAVFSLYGLAVGTAAAWYTQQIWGLSQNLGLTVGGFLAIVLAAVGAQVAWVRLGYRS